MEFITTYKSFSIANVVKQLIQIELGKSSWITKNSFNNICILFNLEGTSYTKGPSSFETSSFLTIKGKSTSKCTLFSLIFPLRALCFCVRWLYIFFSLCTTCSYGEYFYLWYPCKSVAKLFPNILNAMSFVFYSSLISFKYFSHFSTL